MIAGLRARRPDLALSVSATTRAPRPHEVDGVHYHFLDDESFAALAAADGFLESAEYAGSRYGTPEEAVERLLAAGDDVLLEIEVQGARQVRERRPDALLVLLVPPSLADLRERLAARGTETPEAVDRRLEVARSELDQADLFDRVIVNDRVEDAVEQLDRILAVTNAR